MKIGPLVEMFALAGFPCFLIVNHSLLHALVALKAFTQFGNCVDRDHLLYYKAWEPQDKLSASAR